MNEPLVSVLIAAFNEERFIAAAVASVRAQSYPQLEIIIVDDGSTDGTAAILAGYADEPGIRVLSGPNRGAAAARNTALAAASGELIAFCDADDLWHPDKLARQVAALLEHPELAMVHTARTAIDEQGDIIGRPHTRSGRLIIADDSATRQLLHRNHICGASALLRREAFDEIGNFNEDFRLSEDHQFYLRLALKHRFALLDRELYMYRKHAAQSTADREQREYWKEQVLNDFAANFPAAVDSRDLRIARANIHKSRGNDLLKQDQNPAGARAEYLRALKYQPVSPSLWFKLLRSLFAKRKPA